MAKDKIETLVLAEEQPYPVPENWQWYKIESINSYKSETINPFEYSDELFELYSVPSSDEEYPEIIEGKDIGSSKMLVQKGDVLLCKINPRINRVWQVYCFTENRHIASSEWIIVRSKLLNPAYLMYCFRSSYFRKYMLSNVSGVGGSLMRAQPKFVKEYPIPIPPIPEQQRIVDRIESLFAKLDEAKEKAQAVVDGFEDRKAAILHQAFTGKLTEKWREQHGITISSWETYQFGSLVSEVKLGLVKGKTEQAETKCFGYIKMNNITSDGLIDLTGLVRVDATPEEVKTYSLQAGDFLFNTRNSYELVGKNAVWCYSEIPNMLYNNNIMRVRFDGRVLSYYISYFLNSKVGQRELQKVKKNTTNIAAIYAKDLNRIKIPIPQIAEQQQICLTLDGVLKEVRAAKEAAEQVISQIDTMKKAILARAFRGELGTNDPLEPPVNIGIS